MNAIAWVEVPVKDMERAMKFYNTIFDWNLKIDFTGKPMMSFFPYDSTQPGGSGALIKMNKFYKPAKASGALVYFACTDIEASQDLISKNGGKIIIPKTLISPEYGWMAVFEDSEGNRVALYKTA